MPAALPLALTRARRSTAAATNEKIDLSNMRAAGLLVSPPSLLPSYRGVIYRVCLYISHTH